MTLFLFLIASLAGALNAVAGGGSFLTLPALLYAGVTPVAANATSTFAMWPASVSSAIAYRRDITTSSRWLLVLGAVSLVGGLTGGLLLVRTSDTSFMRLLPWLMLLAAVTFSLGNRIKLGTHLQNAAVIGVIQLVISIYGGYFGGGMGIMMLATMSIAGMRDIHEMNGLKSALGAAINGLALLTFILSGAIVWRPGVVMVAGAVIGGYAGASIARRVPRAWIRSVVIVVAWTMTVYFFARSYGA